MTRAAGIMLTTAVGGRALFVKRSPTSDHPGEWCFPGGGIEAGETPEQAVERECMEEIGSTPYRNPIEWTRQISAEGVDYTTFIAKTKDEFVPSLNGEHTAYAWASVSDPPEPLHPGARIALARLTMNELDVARAISVGDLASPQKFGTFWLFAIRITGTGLAFRGAIKDDKGKVVREEEFCWRDASIYLNDDFLARCNGLQVILLHPIKKPKLDSAEFNKRSVGAVFLPFIRGDEVWAIAKIYDADCAEWMATEQVSTSPGVVFNATSGNETVIFSNGTNFLIEGQPALVDHIALCKAGVWDKGGPATGVQNDTLSQQEPIGMTEDEMAAADKARKDAEAKLDAIMDSMRRMDSRLDSMEREDKVRKDAEEKERKDCARHDAARKDKFGKRHDGEKFDAYRARHDADEAAMCDAMRKDGEEEESAKDKAKRARHDAEEEERRADESFEKWANEESEEAEHKADRARKDAEEKERKDAEERERHDAAVNQENADLKTRLAAMEAVIKGITAEVSPTERDALAAAQSRADSVSAMFGDKAPAPTPGETPLAYRKRLLSKFRAHSPRFKESRFDSLDAGMLETIEDVVYHDAVQAARNPATPAVGILVPTTTREGGRDVTRFTGDPMAWMGLYMTPGQSGVFNRPSMRGN